MYGPYQEGQEPQRPASDSKNKGTFHSYLLCLGIQVRRSSMKVLWRKNKKEGYNEREVD